MDGPSSSKPVAAAAPEETATQAQDRYPMDAAPWRSRELFLRLLQATPLGADMERSPDAAAPPPWNEHRGASAPQAGAAPASRSELPDDLHLLLDRLCSQLHVGQAAVADSAHLMLSFDTVVPGLAAELVRDGAFLRVRLHTTEIATLRALSAGRDRLQAALDESTSLHVAVEIVGGEGAERGG